MVWDINKEGIGLQPMIAGIDLNMQIIGGASMVGPLNRLQNALSFNYYGDTTLWWIIAKANGIKGKVALNPETILRIPGNISQIKEKFKNLNKQS